MDQGSLCICLKIRSSAAFGENHHPNRLYPYPGLTRGRRQNVCADGSNGILCHFRRFDFILNLHTDDVCLVPAEGIQEKGNLFRPHDELAIQTL